jgi:hypothetical protein
LRLRAFVVKKTACGEKKRRSDAFVRRIVSTPPSPLASGGPPSTFDAWMPTGSPKPMLMAFANTDRSIFEFLKRLKQPCIIRIQTDSLAALPCCP